VGDGADSFFARVDFGEGKPRRIIDANMYILPTDPAIVRLTCSVTCDGVACPFKLA